MEKIGRGLEIRDGIVMRAVRSLAKRANITEDEAFRRCKEFQSQYPVPPPNSSPELIEAGDVGRPTLTYAKTAIPEKTVVQWWEVDR